MAESFIDVRHLPKGEAYRVLSEQLESVCADERDPVALMATIACLLHHGFGHLWTGFYRADGDRRLVVGPYQGSLGCMDIAMGRGVCGTAAAERRTMVVPDVREFSGHIACDARSLSEIVVPVIAPSGRVIAVLDIDSEALATFDDIDARALESIMTRYAPRLAGMG
jgi:GAF domain-containing protein